MYYIVITVLPFFRKILFFLGFTIYNISDNPWVSPVHAVPKKGGMRMIRNEKMSKFLPVQ